jgi:hypothetical protein
MKPTSKVEAETMLKIIKTFRVSAAAKGADSVGVKDRTADIKDIKGLEGDALAAVNKANEELFSTNDLVAIGITDGDAGITGDIKSSRNVISFGYPDMCLFQILTKQAGNNANSISSVFESALCVIENVAIDYGSQNKMVFFDPGSGSDKFYPAEVTLTISLTETTLTTAGSVTEDHNQPTLTIF